MKHFKILIKPVCTDLIFLITNCVECYDICYNKSRDMTDLTKNHLQKKNGFKCNEFYSELSINIKNISERNPSKRTLI